MIRYAHLACSSLLDTDAYKFFMQQAVFRHYSQVTVTAEFRCRSNELLGSYADEITDAVSAMQYLTLSDEEYEYLASLPFFQSDYLHWLRNFRYNPHQVNVRNHLGELLIRISGPWLEVILWEVPLLALISELVHRYRSPDITTIQAVERVQEKIYAFKKQTNGEDMSGFKLVDFGTRRRFAREMQFAIVSTLKQDFPWLAGTSNCDIARRLHLSPVGTQAHEWFQAHQQISPVLANSQRAALSAWLDVYPEQLGIALTDCIAMDAFLRDFDETLATAYQGLRHDSGDPVQWGEKAIAHYRRLGIDPRNKTLVFSDNLDLDKALALYRYFSTRINVVFGIGTRLTCDIPQVNPLNIVIKLTECNGKPVAKISDSPGKITCHDEDFVLALQMAFKLPLIKITNSAATSSRIANQSAEHR